MPGFGSLNYSVTHVAEFRLSSLFLLFFTVSFYILILADFVATQFDPQRVELDKVCQVPQSLLKHYIFPTKKPLTLGEWFFLFQAQYVIERLLNPFYYQPNGWKQKRRS